MAVSSAALVYALCSLFFPDASTFVFLSTRLMIHIIISSIIHYNTGDITCLSETIPSSNPYLNKSHIFI